MKKKKKDNKKEEKATLAVGATAATAGSVGGVLGVLGICGLCIVPTALAGVALGSVILAVIIGFSGPLLIAGMVLLVASFIIRKKHRENCKVCKAKVNRKKNKI
ncbi:MAG: hypothetical protein KKB03_03940 [Nanoarchaeota archaeon]|nr:hypothetical protein [Nanoarchaeota archaeon]MBU1135854.1 hypothetical protein [Nanoarchaeota archaeon]MBU2520365.1 hypothetical protein [Nanoarchaeota archaeon]